jgi:hypothetical protein
MAEIPVTEMRLKAAAKQLRNYPNSDMVAREVADELTVLASTRTPEAAQVDDAREAFLNMLADAFDFHDEPDCDETGDHTRFVIVTGWRQLAELAEALGIKGPGYMQTWADALERAIATPVLAQVSHPLEGQE